MSLLEIRDPEEVSAVISDYACHLRLIYPLGPFMNAFVNVSLNFILLIMDFYCLIILLGTIIFTVIIWLNSNKAVIVNALIVL